MSEKNGQDAYYCSIHIKMILFKRIRDAFEECKIRGVEVFIRSSTSRAAFSRSRNPSSPLSLHVGPSISRFWRANNQSEITSFSSSIVAVRDPIVYLYSNIHHHSTRTIAYLTISLVTGKVRANPHRFQRSTQRIWYCSIVQQQLTGEATARASS